MLVVICKDKSANTKFCGDSCRHAEYDHRRKVCIDEVVWSVESRVPERLNFEG
ncbi:unannotated protein [freshwater metagenome]|uniref:Unannotated protein n=1 Tax=freshwater metagenome TaxID=449393 RepID=A0A6J6XH11_9ZZZZ